MVSRRELRRIFSRESILSTRVLAVSKKPGSLDLSDTHAIPGMEQIDKNDVGPGKLLGYKRNMVVQVSYRDIPNRPFRTLISMKH